MVNVSKMRPTAVFTGGSKVLVYSLFLVFFWRLGLNPYFLVINLITNCAVMVRVRDLRSTAVYMIGLRLLGFYQF